MDDSGGYGVMKHLLHKWQQLDPATAPTYDAEPASIISAVVSAVDALGWTCGVIPERAGGYRGAVWSGLPPVWIYTSWCLNEHDALTEAFVIALGADRERYAVPVAVAGDRPEDYI